MRRIPPFRQPVEPRRPQDRLPARLPPGGPPAGPTPATQPATWAQRIDANAEKIIGVVVIAAIALASLTGQPMWLAIIPVAAILLYA